MRSPLTMGSQYPLSTLQVPCIHTEYRPQLDMLLKLLKNMKKKLDLFYKMP